MGFTYVSTVVSRTRGGRRLRAIATAVVLGAGLAFGYVVTGGTVTWPGRAAPPGGTDASGGPVGPVNATTTTTTPPPPAPSPVLPFNAKLFSSDVPEPSGGVRSGGCSGALIAPEWIISAGHCFHDVDDNRISGTLPYTVTVTVGKLKESDPGGRTAQIVEVRQSPVHDMAVAKLDTAITDITPIALANTPPAVGQPLQFAGWGSLSPTVRNRTDQLKRGQFTISGIGSNTLEALPVGERTVATVPCPEDSGAPFFVTDDERTGTLVAIVNTGPPCPEAGPEVIARVDVVFDWIQQQIT